MVLTYQSLPAESLSMVGEGQAGSTMLQSGTGLLVSAKPLAKASGDQFSFGRALAYFSFMSRANILPELECT